jgi:serpin B
LSDKEWDAITSNLREVEEEYVIIPKFDFTYSGDKTILETLKELGIEDAFGAKADFSGISESATYVSDVIHKARIKMDEKGAEAAAVTVIGAKEYAAPLNEFFADHPFVFAIRETSTKAILFLGTFRGI